MHFLVFNNFSENNYLRIHWTIFAIFSLHQMKTFWVQMIDLDLFFRYLKEHGHRNQFCENNGKLPISSLWHSKMEWDIATSMCPLTGWNQNCDIPIRFRTTVCQMNEYRPFSAESHHNFHFLPDFNSKTTEPIFTIFTRCRAISGAINACIRKTILHFVSEHESEEWWRSILTLVKIAQN